jgi:hypothetical protein
MGEPGDGGAKQLPPGALEATCEVVVRSTRARAWRTFTTGIMTWWPAGFATRKDARMVLEARLGGRLREDWGRGGGLTWYTVESIDPGRMLLLYGDIGAPYGGPARTHVEVTFDDAPGGTRVRLRDVVFAGATPALRDALASGWKIVIENSFAAHFEAAPSKPRRARRG